MNANDINQVQKLQKHMSKDNNLLNKRKFIESEVDVKEIIIIDNGTQTIKIGRSGQDHPSLIINTLSGFPHVISENDATPPKSVYFGKELAKIIEAKKYNIEFSYPIENSKINDKCIDQMIKLWEYALTEIMGIDPSSADLLIIDSPFNTKEYKAKIIEVLFEKLKVASVLFMNSSVLSLFSIGSTIGLVTEIGHGSSTVVPVYEGYILNHALEKSFISGKCITAELENQLKKDGIVIEAKDNLDYENVIRNVKEKVVKVAFDYENQMKSDNRTTDQKSYELPDGSIIELSKNAVFNPSEILFKQSEGNKSLPQMIQTSLDRCNEDLKQQLMKNAIFCGGSSMLHGIEDRMHKQLSRYGQDLKIEFDWQRKYSSWIGGSMIGSLSTFQLLAIQNKDNIPTHDIIKRIL